MIDTTAAIGEEDSTAMLAAPTTMATGEESGGEPTTMRTGEEELTSAVGDPVNPFGAF
jgi:hypothetical protein